MKVYIPQPIAEQGVALLKEKKYEVCFGSKIDEETLIKEGAGSDAILCRTAKITARVLEACPSLKIVARHGVGYENVDIQRAEELGIWVTNTPEALSVTVAEHTVGLMLAAAKWIVLGDRETRRNNFSIRDRVQGMDIVGKTLGLVGIGRIGSAVARIASAGFGMKILAYDPFARAIPEKVTQVPDLNEMLGNSDFVSLHLPSTVHTRNLIDRKALDRMKRTAWIINTARGDILNEEDLMSALKEKIIAGAALDVFKDEPPIANHPLFALDNVILTPHSAAVTSECLVRLATHAARCIDEVLSGKVPAWPVNRPKNPRK